MKIYHQINIIAFVVHIILDNFNGLLQKWLHFLNLKSLYLGRILFSVKILKLRKENSNSSNSCSNFDLFFVLWRVSILESFR